MFYKIQLSSKILRVSMTYAKLLHVAKMMGIVDKEGVVGRSFIE